MKESLIDIPVIKTFLVNNKPYVYDTYTNQILSISKKHLFEIKELEKCGISEYLSHMKNTQEYNDICLLIDKGYFKSLFVNEVINPETPYIEPILQRGVHDLILQVTRDCNFKCRYCSFTRSCNVDRTHEPIDMSWEVAKLGVDFLFDHSKDLETVSISFYGGEPLLNFKLIKDVVLYAESRFITKKIEYFMTTNASLLNDYIIEFLIAYKFHLSISFDGTEEKQNSHRRFYETGNSTFNIVVNNIDKIKDKNCNYFDKYVRILSVIFNDETYDDAKRFLSSRGIKEENVSYVYASMNGVDYIACNNVIDNTEEKKEEYINNLKKILFDKKTILTSWHHNGPCIPGIHRLFMNVYGDFFPCEKIIELECSKIGDIYNGFDINIIRSHINIGELTKNSCKKCWAMRFCSICVSSCVNISKQCIDQDVKEHICEFQKNEAKKFLNGYIQQKQEICNNE